MSDTITFELPANQYITDVSYDSDHNLYVDSRQITGLKGITHERDILTLSGCSGSYNDVSMNKLEIDNKNHTIKMELQAQGQVQSKVIKHSADRCGFKVK